VPKLEERIGKQQHQNSQAWRQLCLKSAQSAGGVAGRESARPKKKKKPGGTDGNIARGRSGLYLLLAGNEKEKKEKGMAVIEPGNERRGTRKGGGRGEEILLQVPKRLRGPSRLDSKKSIANRREDTSAPRKKNLTRRGGKQPGEEIPLLELHFVAFTHWK